MLLGMDIVIDEDAFKEILQNALTDMEETDVRGRIRRVRHLYFKCILFPLVEGWLRIYLNK